MGGAKPCSAASQQECWTCGASVCRDDLTSIFNTVDVKITFGFIQSNFWCKNRRWSDSDGCKREVERECGAFFLPHTCTAWRRHRTESDTARRHRTPAPEPRWGTETPASEARCPDTFPDLSCQKNKARVGLALGQRSAFTQR